MSFLDRFRRKSKTISTADDLSRYLQSFWETFSGVQVTPLTAMQCTTVYACVRVLSTLLGSLPLHMYQVGKKKERELEHPMVRLLCKRPNEWQTPFQFWQVVTARLMLWGNYYAFKSVGQSGPIRQLLPLDPGQVEPVQDENWMLRYRMPGAGKVETRKKIFHVSGLSVDGFKGLSPVMQNREAIGLAIAIERHQNAGFKNGLKLEGVLEHPQTLSDPAFERLKEEMQNFRGPESSGDTMILEEGMKYSKLAQSAVEAQLLESRKHQRGEIAAIWGVPPHKLADLERATWNNVENTNLDFVIDVLDPYVVGLEQACNSQLLSEEDQERYYFKFNVDALLRGDLKSRYEAYAKGIQWGFINPNEARGREEMEEREGGDVFIQPMNMVPAGWEPADNSSEGNQ